MALVSEQHDLPEPALRPPRFTLRTLWIVMTALCCLFAVMASLGALWSAMLLLFLCLIAAHVVGNSLGTKLRDHTNQQIRFARAARPQRVAEAVASGVTAPEQLTRRAKLNRITLLMAIGGALVGAEFGGLGLAALYPRASIAAVTLGVISSAVLGAFAGFLASSFLSVVRQALAEAHRGAAAATRRTITTDSSSFDVPR
jgi:predicted lipid-binding transport protein (Tim44 family)